MNILTKLMTALRGGANEAGEAIIDTQALRILDQEVRDASEELNRSKDSLAEIIARQKLSEEKCSALDKQIKEYESHALAALKKNKDDLAHEVAEKIAELENQQEQESSAARGYAASANEMRKAIKQTERSLHSMKQQIDTVKATENVQRAQAAVAERHNGSHSKMRTAMDSLERIKEKQSLKAAQMSAAKELHDETSEPSLQERLEDAGITSSGKSASDILERLKAKK